MKLLMHRSSATAAIAATLFAALALAVPSARAADLWVDANYTGSVSNGSSAQPFKAISDTYTVVQPGDTVRVRPGTYYEGVWIKSGTSDSARITYKSEVKWGAKIRTPVSYQNGGCFQYWGGDKIDNVNDPSAWTMEYAPGKKVSPCGWVTIDGFDLHSEKTDTTGGGVWLQWVHHLTIRNCWSHDNAVSGLGASLYDYVIIENNIVNNNSAGSNTGGIWTSGISVWKTRPWDNAAGFHNIIRNNLVYNNHNDLNTPHTDGEGIIIDTTGFDRGTLVEGNVVVNNGSSGILMDGSANCTVRNNTLYQNSWDLDLPEIYANKVTWEKPASNLENSVCKNIQIYGNLVVARTNRLAVRTNSDNLNSSAHHNLRWYSGQSAPSGVPAFFGNNGDLTDTAGTGDVTGQDPQFVNPGLDLWGSDFHLQHYSAAIDKYTVNTLNGKDLDGQPRTGGGSFVDLGAYEYQAIVGQPGFEGLTNVTAPYSFWANGGSFGINAINRQHVGSKNAWIWAPAGSSPQWNALLQTLSGLSPNTTYTMTGWVWNPTGSIGPNAYFGIQSASRVNLGSMTITPSTVNYQKHVFTFNTGSYTSLSLSLGYVTPLNVSSDLRIDDISVSLKTPVP